MPYRRHRPANAGRATSLWRSAVLAAAIGALLSMLAVHEAPATPRAPDATITTVATKIGRPTNITFDPAGRMWTTAGGNFKTASDGVWVSENGRSRQAVKGLDTALGLAWHGGELFVSSRHHPYRDKSRADGRIDAYSGWTGTRFTRRRAVITNLPAGLHGPDSIVSGPDGRLYVGAGSKTNAGPETLARAGTVIAFQPRGGKQIIEARGLRNPYGLTFVPNTTTLLVTDNQRDDLGDNRPPEELNAFDVDGPVPHFGFHRCPPSCGSSAFTRPLANLPAHASSDGVAVIDWPGLGLTAFIAQNGSSFANRTGSDVYIVPIAVDAQGTVTRRGTPRRWASGFRRYDPLGAAAGPDGALYVTLHRTGSVIRIAPR